MGEAKENINHCVRSVEKLKKSSVRLYYVVGYQLKPQAQIGLCGRGAFRRLVAFDQTSFYFGYHKLVRQ